MKTLRQREHDVSNQRHRRETLALSTSLSLPSYTSGVVSCASHEKSLPGSRFAHAARTVSPLTRQGEGMDAAALRYPNTYNRYSTSESCFPPANSSPQQHNRGVTFQTSNARIGNFYERQPVTYRQQQQPVTYPHQQQPVQQPVAYPHQQQIDRLPYAHAHAQHAEVEARLRQARAKLDEAQERLRQTMPQSSKSYHQRPAMGDHGVEVPRAQDKATWRINPQKPMEIRSAVRMSDAGMSRDASEVDSVVFGRDLDGSGGAVQDVRQGSAFAGAAGFTSREIWAAQASVISDDDKTAVRLSDAGMSRYDSEVDDVVFGRDLDGSGDAIKNVREGPSFSGAAGNTSREIWNAKLLGAEIATRPLPRAPSHHDTPFRDAMSRDSCGAPSPVSSTSSPPKYEFAPQIQSSKLFWGGGPDDPSFDPQRKMLGASRERPAALSKRTVEGLNSQLSQVDEVVFGRDMDFSGGEQPSVRMSSQFTGAYGRPSAENIDVANNAGHITRTGGHYPSHMSSALSWPEEYAARRPQHWPNTGSGTGPYAPGTESMPSIPPSPGYQARERLGHQHKGQYRWDLIDTQAAGQ
jgi:hypothetical protein